VVRIPQQDSAKRAFNKLARTFAAQVETLKRYRAHLPNEAWRRRARQVVDAAKPKT